MGKLDKLEELTNKLQNNERVIESILRVQGMYLENTPKEEVFQELLDLLLKATQSEYGFIGEYLISEDGNPYLKTYSITDISWNEETKKLYEESAVSGFVFNNLKTLFGETLKTKKALISNDPKNDPKSGGLPKGHPPLSSYLGMPLFIKEKMIGMFGVANRPDGYNKELIKHIDPLVTSISQLVYAEQMGFGRE
jgi:GAF domain-containing protein